MNVRRAAATAAALLCSWMVLPATAAHASPTYTLVDDAEMNGTYPVGSFSGCTHSGCDPSADPEFGGTPDGTADDSGHCHYNESKTTSESGGILHLHAYTDSSGACYSTNLHMLASTITYGHMQVRYRTDDIPGYHFVVLMWPVDKLTGEIDGPEANIENPWHGFVHEGAGFGNQDVYTQSLPWDGSFHTWNLWWNKPGEGGITMTLDGTALTESGPAITEPDTAMYVAFHLESNMGGAPKPDPAVDGYAGIDWLKVWQEN